jgi:hypothetical protein
VDSVGVVAVDVFAKKLSKMIPVQDDHVIQHLSPRAADPSLGDPILPRTPKGCSLRLDSKILDRLSDPFREYRVTIVDEKSWSRFFGESLAELLYYPGDVGWAVTPK